MSRISFNVNGQRVPDEPYLVAVLKDIQAASVTIMDNLGLARRIKEALPGCLVVHRAFGETEAHKNTSPEALAQRYRQEGAASDGVYRYNINEPVPGDGLSWGDILAWLINLMYTSRAYGVHLCVGNIGPGVFEPEDVERGVFDDYLRALATFDGWHVGGWHDYSGPLLPWGVHYGGRGWADLADPVKVQPSNWTRKDEIPADGPNNWHLMRWAWLDARCRKLGIKIHKKLITEFGVDRMPDLDLQGFYRQWDARWPAPSPHVHLRGFNSHATMYKALFPTWSLDRAIYEQLAWADRVYPAEVIGMHLYQWCPGAQDWDRDFGFDMSQRRELHQLLRSLPVQTPISRKPFPQNSGAPVEAVLSASAGSVNLRIAPDTRAPLAPGVPDGIPNGARVQWYPAVKDTGSGYEWTRVRYTLGPQLWADGWMARVRATWQEQFAPPPREWPAPAVEIDAPFATQRGTGFNNCGPAALASVIRFWATNTGQAEWLKSISVVRIATDMNKGTAYASAGQMEVAGARYGLPVYTRTNNTFEQLLAELNAGRPVIALLERGKLKPGFGNFDGAHFVTVIGHGEGYVIIHDPLGDEGGNGDGWKVAREDFAAAWETTPGNSSRRLALFVPAAAMEPAPPVDEELLAEAVRVRVKLGDAVTALDAFINRLKQL